MKIFAILVCFIGSQLISFNSYSIEQCSQPNDLLGTVYSIETVNLDNDNEKLEGNFELWRKNGDVLHINKSKNITNQWHTINNNYIRQVNYFDDYQKGIEFEPVTISKANWQQKYQLVSEDQLSKMTLISTQGESCDRIEHYKFESKEQTIELWWQPELQLAQKIITNEKETLTIWQLNKTIYSKYKIENVFNKIEHYQMTDYADIGDNESDPFLRKMIRLGFIDHAGSGFYDAQGNQLANDNHH
ncbi:MAG: hypothetical protein P8I03_11920 [Thalassotalea sp.]|nr:hypothetical protein [Thalassotalea sp.]